jgi:hypothetical protein
MALAGWMLLLGLASLYSYHLAQDAPRWYQPAQLAPADQAAAANQTDQKLADLLSYASDIAAAQRRRFLSVQNHQPSPPDRVAPKTITLTELDANAFAAKWSAADGGQASADLSQYIADARLVFLENRLLLAGKLQNLQALNDKVASIEFDPALDDQNRLSLPLSAVYLGQLPVPLRALSKYQAQVRYMLAEELPNLQRRARLYPDGQANPDAAGFIWCRLLLAGMRGQSVDPVIMLPCDLTNIQRSVPVKLESLKIIDQSVTVTIRSLTDAELDEVRTSLHQP